MIKGDKELLKKLQGLPIDIEQAIGEALNATANQVRTTAIKSIQAKSSGETVTRYSQGGKKYSHTASKVGDAPNTDTGALVRSIAVEPARTKLEAYVGTTLEYGKFLEMGTRKMGERPWLYPALNANIKNLQTNVVNAVQRQIDKAAE